MATLFLGNLAWEATEESITSHLSRQPGFLKVVIARHEDSGRNKGWALCTFDTVSNMNDAMVKLKDSVIDGRKIYLRREVDMRDHDPSFNVYIGNLPFRGFEDEQLNALVLTFRPYFCRVKVKRDGSSRGFAIAKFDLEKDAENAIKALNGATHSGRVLEARFDRGVEAVSGDRKCIFVGNLPLDCTAEELKAFFGTVERVQSVQLQSKSGVSAWAIVAYDSMADAVAATKRYSGKEFRSAGPLLSVRLDRKIGKPVAK